VIYFEHVIHECRCLHFLRFVAIFLEFLRFLCSVLRVSPDTDLSRRDRSVSVLAESAAETAIVNHDVYDTCFTNGEDASFKFPNSSKILCIFNFFILVFFILELYCFRSLVSKI